MNRNMRLVVTAVAAVIPFVFAAPASAALRAGTAESLQSNIRWQNDGPGNMGTGGSLFTISRPTLLVPGPANVTMFFETASMGPIVLTEIEFNLLATTVNQPATAVPFEPISQIIQSGSFSFISKNPFIIGDLHYGAGTNLLSAEFSNVFILGTLNRTSGDVIGNSVTGTVNYTSDVVKFSGIGDRGFVLELKFVFPAFFVGPDQALTSFSSRTRASFIDEGGALLVPEPATWAMLIAGFGMVGGAMRRRRTVATTASI